MIQSIKSNETIESNEMTNYMEWTNYNNLKKGEKYKITFESNEYELIFCYYSHGDKFGYCENCDAIFKDNITYYTSDDTWEYYRFITKKEYMSKVRDKFNEKVLTIVLKQIVNDDFEWLHETIS